MKYLSSFSLIAANVLPILGTLYWGWSLSAIIWLYWFESLIIGAFNIPKIALSTGPLQRKIKTILFFIIHYGGFWLIHGLFILMKLMPEVRENADIGTNEINTAFDLSFKWVMFSLLMSHAISFALNFMRRGQAQRVSAQVQMFMPYGRVVILHVLILTGGYFAAKFGTSLAILILLVAMKTVVDLFVHLKSNGLYQLKIPVD